MENEEKKNANEATSKELAQAICLALSAKKAQLDPRILDFTHVEEQMEKQFSLSPVREEGMRDGRWSVLDYGDVIVHIMQDETRLFYHLERLWADGGNLEKYED